jgi:hypothetical protein
LESDFEGYLTVIWMATFWGYLMGIWMSHYRHLHFPCQEIYACFMKRGEIEKENPRDLNLSRPFKK